MNLKLKDLLENYLKVKLTFKSNDDIDLYVNEIVRNYDFKEVLIFWMFALDEEVVDEYLTTNTKYLLSHEKLKKYKYVCFNAENNNSYYGNPFCPEEYVKTVYTNNEDYIQSQINELVELYDSNRLDVFSSRFDKQTSRKFKLKRILKN